MNSILGDFKMAFRSGNILNQLIVINVAVFVVLNIAVFVVFSMAGQAEVFDIIRYYLSVPSNPESLILQPWTLITYMFVHGGVFHILFNMLLLYWFGRIIVEYLGQNKVLGLYVWGGLAGALLYLIIYNVMPLYAGVADRSILFGASAGVLAVVVGAATFQPNFEVQPLLIGRVKIKWIALAAVLMSLYQSVGSNAGGELAHLGGAGLGYLFMTQLQKGNDWSKPVIRFVLWVKSFFTPQPKIKVSYKNEEKFGSRKQRKTASKKATGRAAKTGSTSTQTSQSEIDAILDKISEKGYDALSKDEKQKLFNASKN